LSCTVILLSSYSGYRAYELWRGNHWMTLAKEYAAKRDVKSEALCLQQVLRLNPGNVEGCRMAANLAEAQGSQTALPLRKKVVEMDPNSNDDRLALARTAIYFHDYNTASDALAGVDAAGKNTAIYFSILGEFALVSNKVDEAKSDYASATRLDPSDIGAQLSLAGLELGGTNSLDLAEARINLKRIRLNSTNLLARAEATRELVLDALHVKDYNTALSLSKELIQTPNSPLSDKLLRLDVLRIVKSDEFGSAVASCEKDVADSPEGISHLALWLMQRNLTGQVLPWLQSMPLNVQTNMPVALLAAQCQMVSHNWIALQNSISRENWGSLEFTRHAFMARTLYEQNERDASKAEWEIAVNLGSSRISSLKELLDFSVEWNWQDDAQEILWIVVKNFPQEQEAERALFGMLYQNGNTRQLMELFKTQLNRAPADLDAKNNLALTAMLLNAQELNPYGLAANVYQTNPTNYLYAITYAFSLYLQGKNSDALKIARQLTPQELKNEETSGYYGLILKANGDGNQASTYLKLSLKGQLLPEEKALFQRALSGS
jgi:thioredoxin-like negative regulator of GroEL